MKTIYLVLLSGSIAGQAAAPAALNDPAPSARALIKEAIGLMKQVDEPERSVRLGQFTAALARTGDPDAATEAARGIALEDFRRDAMAAIDKIRQGGSGGRPPEWMLLNELAGRQALRGDLVMARDALARAAASAAGAVGFDRHRGLISVAGAQLRIGDPAGARRTLRLAAHPPGLTVGPDTRAEWVAETVFLQATAGDVAEVESGERRFREVLPTLEAPATRVAALAQLAHARAVLGDKARAQSLLKEAEALAAGFDLRRTMENEVARASREGTPIHVGRQDHNSRALERIAAARWALGDVEGARDAYRQAVGAMDIHNRRLVVRDQASDGDVKGAVASAKDLPAGARRQALILVAAALAETGDVGGAFKLARSLDDPDARANALFRVAVIQADAGDDAGAARTLAPFVRGQIPASRWFLMDVMELQSRLGDADGAVALARQQNAPLDRAAALLGVAKGIMRRQSSEELKVRFGARR